MSFAGQDVAITYLYCNYKEQTDQTSVNLVSSILKQLAENNPAICDQLDLLYEQHLPRKTRASFGEISKALESAITSFDRIFIVIDALDECLEETGARSGLLECLGAFPNTPSIMLTSRPHVHVEASFIDTKELKIVANDQDIETYLRARISYTPRLTRIVKSDRNLIEIIVRTIREKAEGMYVGLDVSFLFKVHYCYCAILGFDFFAIGSQMLFLTAVSGFCWLSSIWIL